MTRKEKVKALKGKEQFGEIVRGSEVCMSVPGDLTSNLSSLKGVRNFGREFSTEPGKNFPSSSAPTTVFRKSGRRGRGEEAEGTG